MYLGRGYKFKLEGQRNQGVDSERVLIFRVLVTGTDIVLLGDLMIPWLCRNIASVLTVFNKPQPIMYNASFLGLNLCSPNSHECMRHKIWVFENPQSVKSKSLNAALNASMSRFSSSSDWAQSLH